MSKISDKYDVIIIGAGIGGLVCGCYLAKAGMKVLIVEKNKRPGGYCTSIEKNGFRYNLGITSFGNYDKTSRLRLVFKDLGIEDNVTFKHINPANVVLTPDFKIIFGSNLECIKDQFQQVFPNERKNISNFFDYVINSSTLQLYLNLKNKTFIEFLDKNFSDYKLKSILCVFLGSLGLSANKVAALSAVIVFREFIIKGGHFLENEFVDKIPLLLSRVFIENGGDLVLSKKISKIKIFNDTTTGVVINRNVVKSDNLISACDPLYTYQYLIGDTYNIGSLKSLEVSGSAFVLYIMIKKNAIKDIDQPNVWLCLNYDVQNSHLNVPNDSKCSFQSNNLFMGIQSRYNRIAYPDDREAVFVIANTDFKDELFWKHESEGLKDNLLKTLLRNLNLGTTDILTSSYITPVDLAEITNNLKATIRGWASIVKQNSTKIFPVRSPIKNLYFTGQWVTSDYVQGGIVMAAVNGKKTAELLIKNYKKKGTPIWK